MNGILGVNELLLLSELSAEQRDYAKTINTSARGLLGILNDILDLSKIQSGQFTLERSVFDLPELLRSLVALHEPEVRQKGVELVLDLSPGVPSSVAGDALRLRQVLTNLLRNAVKFTSRGRIQVKVHPHEGKDNLRFEVRDTGIGLAPEDKKRIFDAFHQADASTTREYGGTGLGLSICRELVHLMGGQIGADGRPGRGSVFWFVVPLAEAAGRPAEPSGPRLASVSSLRTHRRVLVVEDNPVNRKVVTRMLERMNLTVETAEDGQVAVNMWRPGRYTMVFMDVQMPRLDGFDTTRSLRQLEDGRERTPIIALTANAMVGDRERCLAAGMDDYLSKPVVFKELKRVVEHWFGGPSTSDAKDLAETVDQRPNGPELNAKLGA